MPRPIVPPAVNDWINSTAARSTTSQFPLNLCGVLPEDTQRLIARFINENYAWPQIQERAPYEGMWDAILNMYRISLRKADSTIDEDSPAGRDLKKKAGDTTEVADSVVHDAVERLTDITHFVSFKEALPCQFIIPPYYDNRKADAFYDPMRMRIDSMNGVLSWNFDQEEIYRKHLISARHFYLYGITFACSEFAFEAEPVTQMGNDGRQIVTSQFKRLGTTYDPISLRKLWLNYRLPVYEMNYQSCPFFCTETPRWAIIQQAYDPDNCPFGYLNLDKIPETDVDGWMFGSQEMQSMRKAIEGMVNLIQPGGTPGGGSLASLLREEHSVGQLWTFYPMLPLDENTGDWLIRKDGSTVPYNRYVVNMYGQNFSGRQTLLRLQRNFYPRDEVPIYGSCHMPDMDSGLYTPSIGYLLWNHYKQLTKCLAQYITNKDWINNPPSWHSTASPSQHEDINRPGARIPVLGQNDFGWRQPFDATPSTGAMLGILREQAKATSKSTDALMGQAMGSRTSATEASNAFQASMSAVTTPINLFNYDMMGGYAKRMWDYTAMWMPPEVLRALTGQMGTPVSPQDLWLMAGVRTNSGSTYIESIVRQQNIQYILQTGAQDPSLNRTEFWKMLLREFKFSNAEELVDDGGIDNEIQIATEQAIKTFSGMPVIISPDQNHSIAIRVKTRFLEDQESEWMMKHREYAPLIVQQIQQHQMFLMLQLQQQLAHASAGMPIPSGNTAMIASGAQPPNAPTMIENAGDAAQQSHANTM